MDEFSDQFRSAFKGTVHRVKKGYRFTKKTLKDIRMDPLKLDKKDEGESNGNFKHNDHKHEGEEPHPESDTHMRDSEHSEVMMMESHEEEMLTDEQVQLQVDRKYFDCTYDAVKYELMHLVPSYCDIEEEVQNEQEGMNTRILDLHQKCAIVSTTLERRVLAHYAEFVRGVEEIRSVNDSLLQTSSDCKKARTGIRRSKALAASQVTLLGLIRTRGNVADTLNLIEAIDRIVWRRNQFAALISSGRLTDAMRLLHKEEEENSIEIENRLMGVHSIKEMINDWRSYQRNPQLVGECVEVALDKCLTHRFVESTYCNLVGSSTVMVGKTPRDLGNQIAQFLWCIAAQILTKSLLEISQLKDESASIADLAEGIQPKHLLLCFCQMAAKLVDFLYMYARIIRLHSKESRRRDSDFAAVHADVLHCVKGIGHRIGNDLLQKLTLTVTHMKVEQLDITRGLHLFVVIDMLLEAVKITGIDRAELKFAHRQIQERLERFVALHFQLPKAVEVLWWMTEDNWSMSDLSALSLSVVRPISSKPYQVSIKAVKDYVENAQRENENGEGREAALENPFYAAEVIDPPDLSVFIQTETFGQYWTKVKKSLDSGSLCSASVISNNNAANSNSNIISIITSQEAGTTSGLGSFVDVHGSSLNNNDNDSNNNSIVTEALGEALLGGSLSARVSIPPTVLTSSAILLSKTLTEYAARVVIRYPPLAANIINWTSDLVSLYIYTIADNFVSISKSVPIERQNDFSQRTQDILTEMHISAEKAVGSENGCVYFPEQLTSSTNNTNIPLSEGNTAAAWVRFPPRIWDRIRQEYASKTHYYALVNRVVACESCIALVFQQEALVSSLVQLLPSSLAEEHFRRVKAFYGAAMELLHMCIYCVCQAIYPMEAICGEIAKLRPKKDEIHESSYVKDIISEMKTLNERRPAMPTPVLDTSFLQRFIFSVQTTLVREYSKLFKRKLNDITVMQIQIDAQNFQQQVAATFGRYNVVFPDYIVNLIKTGFYMDSREKRLSWLPLHHNLYFAADLVNWLSGGDRGFKQMLEDILRNDLNHHDALPMDPFLH